MFVKTGNIVAGVIYDPINKEIIRGRLVIEEGRIIKIERDESVVGPIILPGFVDSHIHIESSMLTPLQFSKVAKRHGTIAVVADPHEIANVAGVDGIDFMINSAKDAEVKFYFGAPSCVPASPFDDCYEAIDYLGIEKLLKRKDIYFLGEMMNFPGVINSNQEVLKKLDAAKSYGKPADGHAPGLKGDLLVKYIDAGIDTDHECFILDEAVEKISKGMKIIIREGSAAKNFNALNSLIKKHPENTMFCTDDCHPEDLIIGHINSLVKRSLKLGYSIFDILQVASVNPIRHYGLDLGLLQVGNYADFIVIDNLENLSILGSYVRGVNILENENVNEEGKKAKVYYTFTESVDLENLKLTARANTIKAIKVIEGELVTDQIDYKAKTQNNFVISDVTNDFLKVAVVNRYKDNEIFVGFINGFGLKKGAIAESIAHDSHHIIAVGVDDESIHNALQYVIGQKGGLCYYDGNSLWGLPLPIYGLMSNEPADIVADKYKEINAKVIGDGCLLKAPFMTLSFMALSVIPKLKITPKGLFDVNQFKFIDQFIE